jgi:hypothetical protein
VKKVGGVKTGGGHQKNQGLTGESNKRGDKKLTGPWSGVTRVCILKELGAGTSVVPRDATQRGCLCCGRCCLVFLCLSRRSLLVSSIFYGFDVKWRVFIL